MLAYASHTGTKTTLAAMRAAGWRCLLVATGAHGRWDPKGWEYAIDNGAYAAWTRQEPWDERLFLKILDRYGKQADFITAPDIVAGGLESLRFSESWLARLESFGQRRLIAVQDGMVAADVRDLLGPTVGIFVGGTVEWKLATLQSWADLAHARNAWCHVGKVNSALRIRKCLRAGVNSFDGTSVTRFPCTLPKLNNSRNQGTWTFR